MKLWLGAACVVLGFFLWRWGFWGIVRRRRMDTPLTDHWIAEHRYDHQGDRRSNGR